MNPVCSPISHIYLLVRLIVTNYTQNPKSGRNCVLFILDLSVICNLDLAHNLVSQIPHKFNLPPSFLISNLCARSSLINLVSFSKSNKALYITNFLEIFLTFTTAVTKITLSTEEAWCTKAWEVYGCSDSIFEFELDEYLCNK